MFAKNFNTHKKTVISVAVSAAVSLATVVHAENTENYKIETIEVTASKRVESIQSVPVSISAFSEEMISSSGVNTLTDVIPMIPGLTGKTYGIATNTWAIRGISTNDWSAGSEPSVAVFFDEAYIGRNALATGAFFDVGRIEVVKGPQGTLFGRNASAGAISIISNKPEDETNFSAGLVVGNEGKREYNAMANIAVNDELSFRAAYFGSRLEGIWQDVVQNEEAFTDNDSVRFMTLWSPTDDFEALLTLNYSDAAGNMGGAYNVATSIVAPGEEFPDKVARSQKERELVESHGVNLNLAWYLNNNFTVTSITDFRGYDSAYIQDLDATADDATIDYIMDIFAGGDGTGGTGGMSLEFQTAYSDQQSISQEFRLNGSTEQTEWFIGVSYFNEEIDEQVQINLHDTALGLGLLGQDMSTVRGETESVGVYGDIEWALSDDWSITTGVRWSQDKKDWCTEVSTELYLLGTPTEEKLCDNASWSEVTPRMILDYSLNRNVMIFSSISKGYKGGGFNPSPTDSNEDNIGDTILAFAPETNTAYEVGVKSTLLDGRIQLNASTYFNDYIDLQVQTETLAGIFISNAAEAETKGIEVEMTFMATADLALSANYSFNDAVFTKGELQGNALAYAPENSFSFSANYEMEFFNGRLNWFAMYNWQDEFYFDTINSLKEDSYGLVNAKVTYTPVSERWNIAIGGDNLTNVDYAAYRQDIGLEIGQSINRGMPRMITAEVNFYF